METIGKRVGKYMDGGMDAISFFKKIHFNSMTEKNGGRTTMMRGVQAFVI